MEPLMSGKAKLILSLFLTNSLASRNSMKRFFVILTETENDLQPGFFLPSLKLFGLAS